MASKKNLDTKDSNFQMTKITKEPGAFMDLYQKLLNDDKFFLIAGPCVIEDEKMMLETAEFLKHETEKRNITLIFKASFKKANRTSYLSPVGPGIQKGLEILQKIKTELSLPILTDVHEIDEVKPVSEVADIIQIPAFLCRQTDLITASADTGKIVNIKKGQFMAPEDMEAAVGKIIARKSERILVTERGTSFGYHNLVVDFRGFAIMKKLGYPVIYDVTHSLQRPSVGTTSGGTPEFAPMMARAALATGKVDGLFIETHPNPAEALSDSSTMLPLDSIPGLLDECLSIIRK